MNNQYIFMREKMAILDWLKANDWKPNKITTGEWETTDERWIQYLEERKTRRERLDEINTILTTMRQSQE